MAYKVKHFLHQVNPRCVPSMAMHINCLHPVNSAAVERCLYALATLAQPFQTGFHHYWRCHQCILTLLTLCPPEPQSKLYTMRWTIACSKMLYGQRAAFSCDNRIRMAVRFSHVSSQVFLTGKGISGSQSSTPH